MLEHNLQLLSQEKFRLAVGMVRWVHTPLVLLRNSLEDIIRSNTPEDYRALKPLLKHTECIINYSQNVMCLDRAGWKRGIDTLTAEVEIHNYIQMIANQCRSYADLHHIQIEINHSIGHASCKINEVIMTIALQHLLNRMIEKTTPGDCIYLTTSHNTELWQLQISNYQRAEKKSFTAFFPIPNLGNLRTVRKIIRLHGGKLITYRCKKSTIFQITVPANCHCPNQTKHIPEIFFPKQADPDRPDRKVPKHYKEKEDIPTTKDIPHILLVMADNRFGDYLKTALSGEFDILLQKKLDIPALTTINKKPDAITTMYKSEFKQKAWSLPVGDLLYVGRSTNKKLQRIGVKTIGDLAKMDVSILHSHLGKMGDILWSFANGYDDSPVKLENTHAPIKSVGNSTTTPKDLECDEDVKIVIYILAESVAARLRENGFKCRVVEISVRDNELFSFTRQKKIDHATNITGEIAAYAFQIFTENYNWSKPIRSIGVRGSDLVTDNYWEQIDLFSSVEMREKQMKMDAAVDDIRRRFGFYSIQRGLMYQDKVLSAVNAKEDHTVHPHGFFG